MDRRAEAALAKLAGDPKVAHAPESLAALVARKHVLLPKKLRRV